MFFKFSTFLHNPSYDQGCQNQNQQQVVTSASYKSMVSNTNIVQHAITTDTQSLTPVSNPVVGNLGIYAGINFSWHRNSPGTMQI